MSRKMRKLGRVSVQLGLLLASATFCIVGLVAGSRSPGLAGGIPMTAGPITDLDVSYEITPNPAHVGDMVTGSGMLTVVGGPGPVKITITVPTVDGGDIQGSFTTTVDENGTFGIQLPPVEAGGYPGTYTGTVKVESGSVSDTEVFTYTVLPPL